MDRLERSPKFYKRNYLHLHPTRRANSVRRKNRVEIISNLENAGNYTGCELCKSLEVQLSHVLKELSSVRLIVDLLSKELNREQSESPRNSTTNKQWNQVSYINRKHLTVKKV